MSGTKLLPCPFCGGEAHVSFNTAYGFVPWCDNEDCILNELTKGYESEKQAIEAWNTRKPIDDIVERLQDELERSGKEKERTIKENPLQFDRVVGCSNGIVVAIDIVREAGGLDDNRTDD